jgi:hypothetical protein
MRYEFNPINGDSENNVDNLQHAATICAHDVPMMEGTPYTVQTGDGIKRSRVIFHFKAAAPNGLTPREIIERTKSPVWLKENPNHSIAVCKRAFDAFYLIKGFIKGTRVISEGINTVQMGNTRFAAVMVAMGHFMTQTRHGEKYVWHFPESAGIDSDLLHMPDLYDRQPSLPISFAKAAIMGHAEMLNLLKSPTHYNIQHKGRTAIIGRHAPQNQINIIDKLLYRK